MTPLERYAEALRNLPPSGGGGCHAALLSLANRGRLAGIDAEQIASDLARCVHGTRKVTRREIDDAVRKAFSSTAPPRRVPYVAVNGPKLLNHILARGGGFTLDHLRAQSPIPIAWQPECDFVETLRYLYRPDDRLFVGAREDAGPRHVRPVPEWISRWERGAPVPEHVIVNPLSGELGKTKDGKPSYRSDDCVISFPFTVIEFDHLPLEQQVLFWAGAKLNVVALVHSGGKSIHGWCRVDAANAAEWAQRVRQKLFDFLVPLGVDGTSRNESRLSRAPGHFRRAKGNWQRLLYLDPVGGPIIR